MTTSSPAPPPADLVSRAIAFLPIAFHTQGLLAIKHFRRFSSRFKREIYGPRQMNHMWINGKMYFLGNEQLLTVHRSL